MTLDEQIQLINASDLAKSRKYGCRLLTYALYPLRDIKEPTRVAEIKNRIRTEFPLDEYDLENYEKSGYKRWETLLQMFSIDYVKSGFIKKTRSGWLVTEEGKEYLDAHDPIAMFLEATRRYQEWSKANPKKKKEVRDADELPESYRIWLMAPGESAKYWQSFQDKGEVSIGWDNVGDLTSLTTLRSCTEKINALRNDGVDHNKIGRCLWEFAHKMEPGDILVMKDGMTSYIGVGVVTSHS